MSEIERFIKATDAAWASASWAAEDVASASAAMNDYMKARDILRGELAAREWVGLTDEDLHDLQIEHLDDPWANFKAIEQALKEKNT
jgi:hypothetical protein